MWRLGLVSAGTREPDATSPGSHLSFRTLQKIATETEPPMKMGPRLHTRLIIEECRKAAFTQSGGQRPSQCHWETGGTMEPVRETFAKTDGKPRRG